MAECSTLVLTQQWEIGEDLKASPVSDNESLDTKDGLSQGERYLDGNSDEHRELEPDMFHGQDKADHEATNAAHPSDDSQYSVAHTSPGSPTESSTIVDDLFRERWRKWGNFPYLILTQWIF